MCVCVCCWRRQAAREVGCNFMKCALSKMTFDLSEVTCRSRDFTVQSIGVKMPELVWLCSFLERIYSAP